MTNEEINLLIEKYLAGKANTQERELLMQWYRDVSQTEMELWLKNPQEKDTMQQHMLAELKQRIVHPHYLRATRQWMKTIAVAASIVLIIGVAYWWLQSSSGKSNKEDMIAARHDVAAPTVAKATLKLADGRIVLLDSATSGSLATQANAIVVKLADGRIAYQPTATIHQSIIQYNTITNPRGSKVISLTLADGTQIWLNAASSITYPTAFTGSERKVEITGEAYFKVIHNSQRPFKVAVNGMEVTDVGTEFNIKAYGDEKEIQTTLIEGSVKISHRAGTTSSANTETIFMKPGEQAIATGDAAFVVQRPEVLEEVTAWKEGLFHFESTALPVILKEFSRWYDIDLEYSGRIPTDKFFLIFKRSSSLATVLEALRVSGVKFLIEGRKLIVQPG